MKKGDKVFAARDGFYDDVTVYEATVEVVYAGGKVKLSGRELGWGCRLVVPAAECHASRAEAIRALRDDAASAVKSAEARLARIVAALAAEAP